MAKTIIISTETAEEAFPFAADGNAQTMAKEWLADGSYFHGDDDEPEAVHPEAHYRVYAGEFESREAAEESGAEIEDEGMVKITIRPAREYVVNYREECGGTGSDSFTIEAGTPEWQDETALAKAEELTEGWVRDGEYGDEGASVRAWFTLEDDDSEWDEISIDVEIEPNHEALIAAVGDEYANCDHEWTAEGESGCTENPGVWSVGGTTMVFYTHCEHCGLRRKETSTGSQRNPGDHDAVEYFAPEAETEAA